LAERAIERRRRRQRWCFAIVPNHAHGERGHHAESVELTLALLHENGCTECLPPPTPEKNDFSLLKSVLEPLLASS